MSEEYLWQEILVTTLTENKLKYVVRSEIEIMRKYLVMIMTVVLSLPFFKKEPYWLC